MKKFKIKNWTLAIIALIFFCLLMSLGFWQLKRAAEKKQLLRTYQERILQPHHTLASLTLEGEDLRFYRTTLKGHFDQDHIFLLDNKIFHGKIGYEIYVPFKVSGFNMPAILVDRGFVPIKTREQLPVMTKITVDSISGMLNLPPAYFALGAMVDQTAHTWPLRVEASTAALAIPCFQERSSCPRRSIPSLVAEPAPACFKQGSFKHGMAKAAVEVRIEYVNLKKIEKIIGYPLFPYILSLTPNHPAALPIEWQIIIMGPERHLGYAFQWFALAFTLLILFVALNIKHS